MNAPSHRQGSAAIILAIAAVLLAFALSVGLGFLASISILQITLQAAVAINLHLLAPRSGSGTRVKPYEPLGVRTIELTIFTAAFAVAGIACLTGLLHSGDLAGWLAIGAATAGTANLIAARQTDTIPASASSSVMTSSLAASAKGAPRRVPDAVAIALVEVQRVSGGYTEHLHPFEVVIDEKVVGRLGPGESGVFQVAPGSHELIVMIEWCRSERVDVQLRRDQKMTFRCETRANLLTDAYWATIGRRRYLRLTEIVS